MEENVCVYSIQELKAIGEKVPKPAKMLDEEALAKILDLKNFDHKNVISNKGRAEAKNRDAKAYEPMSKLIDQGIQSKDSLKSQQLFVRKEFNRVSNTNFPNVAANMTSKSRNLITPQFIAFIIVDSVISNANSVPEKSKFWGIWAKLLVSLKEKSPSIESEIVKESRIKIDNEIRDKNDILIMQSVGCWISTLYNSEYFSPSVYAETMYSIVRKLNREAAAAVVLSSLTISGPTLDKYVHSNSAFLFCFLQRQVRGSYKISSYLRFPILDLLELRENDWNPAKMQQSINRQKQAHGTQAKNTQNTLPIHKGEKSIEDIREKWDLQFSVFSENSNSYRVHDFENENGDLTAAALLHLLIGKKAQIREKFSEFVNIVIKKKFPEKKMFLEVMKKLKHTFRASIENEEDTLKAEYHKRFYSIVVRYLADMEKSLFSILESLFSIYFCTNNKDANNNDNSIDPNLCPIPSVFVDSVSELYFYILNDDSEGLTPEECNVICSKFPQDDKFNKLVFPTSEKKEDFWAFISKLISITNPDLIDKYFEKEKNNSYSCYDRALFLYNEYFKLYEDPSADHVVPEDTIAKINIAFSNSDSPKSTERCISSVLELLMSHDNLISKEEMKIISNYLIKDVIGTTT